MRLLDVKTSLRPEGIRLTGIIEKQNRERFELYFDLQVPRPMETTAAADAFAAAMLIPAMHSGESLEIDLPLSPQLCFRLPRIRDIFHAWFPEFSRVDIRTMPRTTGEGMPELYAGTFFSGGVDSFYSLLKHKHGFGTLPAPLTHIIFMRGIETRLEESKDVDKAEQWVRQVAAAAGVQYTFGESNIRMCFQAVGSGIRWADHYYGSSLAAIALALSSTLGYVCIPSSYSYTHLIAHGSTPLLDEMYSTERTHVIHDGSEVTRPVKVAKILEWDRDLILAHLRVCHLNWGGAFNCGKCYKCVRTAIPLRVLGVLEQARTFPNKSMDHWERTILQDRPALTEENLHFARKYGGDASLIAMLERVVRKQRRGAGLRLFLENSPFHALLPALVRARHAFHRVPR